jgi:F0F1-type ATP synthase membrane subunit c/vacuolar-type H+-ATPase subunit K
LVTLSGTGLIQNLTGSPLRDMEFILDRVDGGSFFGKGLLVSLRDIFQHLVVQRQMDDKFIQSFILVFQLFETLGFFRLHTAVLIPPTQISRFTDFQDL